MKSRQQQHQGVMTPKDKKLEAFLRRCRKRHVTTLEVQLITGCVSARDKIRKLRANGVPVGNARFLYKSKNGASVFGWKIA